MGWSSALKRSGQPEFSIPNFPIENVDWSRLVSLDFETYYDADYTLKKLSTSAYIRDKRFEALMCGIKIGGKVTAVVPGPKIAAALKKIPWETHSLLAHHAQFDGLILSHHYGIKPKKIYCSLSMARGLHSNEIGPGLDEVSKFYSGSGKTESGTEDFKGLSYKALAADQLRYARAVKYCANDVEEMYRIFRLMVPKMPRDEMDLIHHVVSCFTDPVLQLDEPRCLAEYKRELERKRNLLLQIAGEVGDVKLTAARKKKLGAAADDEAVVIEKAKQLIGSAKFADLLAAEGIDPPKKISPAWFKHKDDTKKWINAFSKTDLEFMELQAHPSQKVRDLVEMRLNVKSSGIETRAAHFLTLGKNGAKLPVYYKYAAAHTIRLGGGDKTNFQNLKRGGELRQCIKAQENNVLVVADSGQIEARVNAWLWGQDDLLQAFEDADAGRDRDAYCKFGDLMYGRVITKADKDERFVGKVCILGLGYQMGAPKLQTTLALGTMGPPVYLDLAVCQTAVNTYRRANHKIRDGWKKCQQIIEDMATGRKGAWKCISWDKETIYLPDGMKLHYPDLRAENTGEWIEYSYLRKGSRAKIYGGLLNENIVQALAKIIVMGQLLTIAKKYRVVMTTHDEIVAHVKKLLGQRALEFMLKTMRTPPPWCADIPLNAEGGFAGNYSK